MSTIRNLTCGICGKEYKTSCPTCAPIQNLNDVDFSYFYEYGIRNGYTREQIDKLKININSACSLEHYAVYLLVREHIKRLIERDEVIKNLSKYSIDRNVVLWYTDNVKKYLLDNIYDIKSQTIEVESEVVERKPRKNKYNKGATA